MRAALTVCVCCLLCGPGGCLAPGGGAPEKVTKTPPRAVQHVYRMYLQAKPAAWNWDERPGPDGVEARVYFFLHPDKTRLPVTISGNLEFLLFEGKVPAAEMPAAKPLRSWAFTPAQLAASVSRSMVGWGYGFRLGWGEKRPRSDMVTLTARYGALDGRSLYASPVTIAVQPK